MICELSFGTVARLSSAVKTKDTVRLRHLLSPAAHKAGARPVLTKEEEELVMAKMIDVAGKGFAIDIQTLRSIMDSVAGDGRSGFKHGLPGFDTIRSFRACNRNITLRNAENKDKDKIKGECFEHLRPCSEGCSCKSWIF